ncbi:MAG TPA: FlgD immunoglobulin-like domain containing protein [Steroidobacteraceae bacterium]|nr:FlgD immunoglobulin-like domain containing protein [Steroidobacteraceae bacterium]
MSASTLPIGSTLNSPATGSASSAGTIDGIPANEQISQAGFLQLISAQMQSQNPLNPTDPTQFLTQIEGLSEVSSLQSLQTSIAGLTAGLQSAQMLNGTALLGHSVLAPGSSATLAAGGTVSGAVSAPSGATSLTVSVSDSSGALVDAFAVAPQSSGYSKFTWNGTTTGGSAAPAGQYSLSVTAAVGGASQSVSPLVYSQVQSVTIDPSTQTLDLNTVNGTVPLSSVVNIQ